MRLEQCNEAIIDSALASPAASFGGVERYPDLQSKAAVLAYSLAKSQACLDGNKRIALILLNEFLAINGSSLEMSNQGAADMIVYAAESDPNYRDQVILELTRRLEPAVVDLTDEEDE